MLSDRSASYPSSPTRRKAALDDTPLDTREAMLLPPPSDGLHGYGSRASAAAAEEGGASGLGLGGDEPTREPARRTVEPWGSLLLSDQDQEEDDAQDRKFAEVVLVEGREEQERAILQDVTRTRSGTPALRDEKVLQWLQRSVSLFCQERGLQYAQGLTELAAPWALITDPPCLGSFSYRCFCAFVDRFAPNIFATAPEEGATAKGGLGGGGFVVLETHLVLLELLLRFHDPALAAHLDKCCVSPAAYATPWFVTVFARQLPIPALLRLWRLLIEHGDPVLHQFLALAWLVNNRRVLLDAPREDVPKAASSLRLQSLQDVDGLFGAAVALQAGTPRLVCGTLRRACYGGTVAQGGQPAAGGAGGAGGAASKEEGSHGRGDEPVSSDDTTTTMSSAVVVTAAARVSLLEGLRAAGMLLVDADQVAEILLAQQRSPSTAHESKENGRYWGATRSGGRFVLVDCRGATGGVGAAEDAVRAREEAVGGRVVWRRVPPAKSIGREAAAVAEILRELGAGARGVEQGDAEVGDSSSDHPSKLAVSGETSSGVVTAPYGAGDTNSRATSGGGSGNGGGSGGVSSASSYVGTHEVGATAAVDAATHVCFIGNSGNSSNSSSELGRRSSRSNDGDSLSFTSTAAAAAAAEAAAPEFRLARAASRSCLAAHVCVLEGGFSALDEALSRRGFFSSGGGTPGVEVVAGNPSEPSQVASPLGNGDKTVDDPRKGEAVVPVSATVVAAGQSQSAGASGGELSPASGGTARRRVASAASVTAAAAAAAGESAARAGGGGGSPVSPPLSQAVERRASRLVGNRRVSEPFRVYAAKSADEMGRALRSLPLAASKPLEDAARVCNSLARTNVRALGDSRLSLSRSITQLEQLNARMDGTASGFAKYFGAGRQPKGGDGSV